MVFFEAVRTAELYQVVFQGGVMKKFWIGDVPLSVAYWVYGWLLPMGLALVLIIVGVTLVPGSLSARSFLLAVCCYAVFWGVGTWRAATKYQGLKVWAVLAKVHIVAPLVVLVLAFTTLAVVEQQRDSVAGSANEQMMIADERSEIPSTTKQELRTECRTTMAEVRAKIPELHGLDDSSAIRVLRQIYYPEMTVEQISAFVCVRGAAEPDRQPAIKKLGWLDQRRYESCQQDAAKAPTAQGVAVGVRICREKFGQ